MARPSLAYRKNERAILRGKAPEKYTRLLPHIPTGRILELGSAEGVLSLLLARRGDQVTALERSRERHESALNLSGIWDVDAEFICGDITDRLDLLEGKDVFVAVRSIYYLRAALDEVFAEVAAHIPVAVLCGNRQRAAWWRDGVSDRAGGPLNQYASHEGMTALLERHGYTITDVVTEGDPVVCGTRV